MQRKVTFSADHLEKRLINMGVDVKSIKSEEQLKQILAYVKQAQDQAFAERFGHILKNNKFTKEADVLDLTGKKIDMSKPIQGGKNVPETDIVTETIITIKSKKPIDAMKEANLVIARKGKYKNLTIDESQDILKKTNDHIF